MGTMEPITTKLRRTRLFAGLPEEAVVALIERPGLARGAAGDSVPARHGDLVVLLEGGLAMGSNDGGEHIAAFSVEEGARDPAILYTIPANARLTLSRPSVYLVIDGERLDDLMSGRQEAKSLSALDESVRGRVSSLLGAQAFKQMPFERLVRCAEAMEEVEVDVGEEIVKQGDPGDYFYVLKAGSAEVRRAQEGTSPAKVAMLSAGDSFGEEALLKGEPRNATVHMTTPGRILKLRKEDFEALIGSQLLHEIGAEEARRKADFGDAVLVDCRFEEEWELWRLKGARLVPLEEIRERSRGLDPKREYIVYCRTGRRSRAAAFLMRQAGLRAVSLAGGIAAWPYEREASE